MARYKNAELREMVIACLEARDKGILSYWQLVQALSMHFMLPQRVVEQKILELTKLKD